MGLWWVRVVVIKECVMMAVALKVVAMITSVPSAVIMFASNGQLKRSLSH